MVTPFLDIYVIFLLFHGCKGNENILKHSNIVAFLHFLGIKR